MAKTRGTQEPQVLTTLSSTSTCGITLSSTCFHCIAEQPQRVYPGLAACCVECPTHTHTQDAESVKEVCGFLTLSLSYNGMCIAFCYCCYYCLSFFNGQHVHGLFTEVCSNNIVRV